MLSSSNLKFITENFLVVEITIGSKSSCQSIEGSKFIVNAISTGQVKGKLNSIIYKISKHSREKKQINKVVEIRRLTKR